MTKVETQKKRLERETFCRKMWIDIEKKKEEIREGVEKYKERLIPKPSTVKGKSNKPNQSRNVKLASGDK